MKWIFLILTISVLTSYGQYNLPLSYSHQQTIRQLGNYRAMGDFSTKGSGASQNFNVHHYKCDWSVNPADHYIKGSVDVAFQTTQDAEFIALDLNDSLRVDSIVFKSSRLSFLHEQNVLKIDFGYSLPAMENASVTIYYQGRPPVNGFGSFTTSTHSGIPVMWTLSEPYGSRDWWPCKDGLQDKADSIDVFITAPEIYTSVSNGVRVQQTAVNGWKTTHWKHRYPITTYLVCLAVTNYAEFINEWDVAGGPLTMQTFCYPEHLNVFVEETPKAYEAMKYFSGTIEPYPFIKEKYGHVQFGFGGGEEHQTSTFINWPGESLMAHEMAHQWFGDKVTCRSWQHIWLNEGFATHMASMYMEQKYPATAIPTRKSEIENITSVPDGSVFVDDTTAVRRIFNNRLSYTKGSHLLYMLRFIIGDSAFFKGVRNYLDDPGLSYGFAVTADLQRHLEQAANKSLDYFFNEWFYGQGYPSYKLEWWQQSDGVIGLRVAQTTSHPSVSFFHLPLPIRLAGNAQTKDFVIQPDFNGQIFYLKNSFRVDSIKIDPDYWLITKGNTSVMIEKPQEQMLLQVFPNPVHDLVNIHANGFEETAMSLQIFDAMGRLVIQKNLNLNGSINTSLNTQQLPAAIYILKITTSKGFKKVYKIKKGL